MDIKGVSSVSGESGYVSEQKVAERATGEEAIEGFQTERKNELSKEELAKEIEHLNKFLEARSSHLKFVLHDELNKYYVQVIDDQSQEVLKEIPSKKMMDIVANFYEKLGLIVDTKI